MVTTWAALAAIGLSPDDRDRARAGDMIRTAAFDAAITDDTDPEICIRGVLSAAGHRGGTWPGLQSWQARQKTVHEGTSRFCVPEETNLCQRTAG